LLFGPEPLKWREWGKKKETSMADVQNLVRNERIIRAIVGGVLIIVGFYLPGFLKPLTLVLGLCFLFTAYIAY
jgi:hypothetical protein